MNTPLNLFDITYQLIFIKIDPEHSSVDIFNN